MNARNRFERKAAIYAPAPTALIICEDAKSCRRYLESAARHYRSSARIRVTFCGNTDPIGIVEEAIRENRNFDEVFCVIDRDRHARFDEAVAKAAENGVRVIASYPCYEYWLLLHFKFTRAGFVAQGAKSPGQCVVDDLRRCEGMQDYQKGQDVDMFDFLLQRLPQAKENASRAKKDAEAVNEPNPSTQLHVMIERIEALGRLVRK